MKSGKLNFLEPSGPIQACNWTAFILNIEISIKIYNTVETQQIYYILPLPGYMFRLLRVIIRPSNKLIQDYLIPR